MLPMIALRESLGTLLAADTAHLNQAANANVMALIMAPFTPGEDLVIGDLTLATFTGNTPIAQVLGAAQTGLDPATGAQIVTIPPPAGGWRWITGDLVNLPQSIYGYCLCTHALAALVGVTQFATPISLGAAGQEINLGDVQMILSMTPFIGN